MTIWWCALLLVRSRAHCARRFFLHLVHLSQKIPLSITCTSSLSHFFAQFRDRLSLIWPHVCFIVWSSPADKLSIYCNRLLLRRANDNEYVCVELHQFLNSYSWKTRLFGVWALMLAQLIILIVSWSLVLAWRALPLRSFSVRVEDF